MEQKIMDFVDTFIEGAGEMGSGLGLNRSVAQLYALLYLSNTPLSLDDMANHLKISKGNVSMNIRILESWNAVRKVWVKGSRKDYYEADLDILKIIVTRLKEGLNRRMSQALSLLQNAEQTIAENNQNGNTKDKEQFKVFQERIDRIKKIHSMTTALLTTISPEKFLMETL